MSPKAAGLLLAVLVVLFAVGVGAGAIGDEGDSNDRPALVEGIGDAAGDPAAVPRDDITAGCIDDADPNLLVVPGGLGASCVVVVRSDDQLRLVRFEAVDPIHVQAPAPDGDVTVDDDPDPGDDDGGAFSVAVGDGETEIRLTCAVGSCRVRLVG